MMLVTCEFLVVMLMFMCPKMNEGNLIQKQRNSCFLVMVKKPKDIDYMIRNEIRSFLVEMYIFTKPGKTIHWNHLRSNIQKLKRLFFKMTKTQKTMMKNLKCYQRFNKRFKNQL